MRRHGFFLLATIFLVSFVLVALGKRRTPVANSFDGSLETGVHNLFVPHELPELRVATFLGSTAFLVPVSVVAFIVLLLYGRRRQDALLFACSVAGAFVLGEILKHLVRRPRPHLFAWPASITGYSFPSGHSLMSAAVYGSLALILSSSAISKSGRYNFFLLAILLIAVIGVSRVALAVHWPTDVLGGWTLGLGWTFLVFGVLSRNG